MKKLITSVILLAFASKIIANEPAYRFVQASYVQWEFADIPNFKSRGFEVKGGYDFGETFFAELSYLKANGKRNDANLEVDQWHGSVGYIHRFSTATAADVRIGYGKLFWEGRSKLANLSTSTLFYSVGVNVRNQLTERFEVSAGLEYQNWKINSIQKAYNVGVQYNLNRASVGVKYSKYSDSEYVGLFARYHF